MQNTPEQICQRRFDFAAYLDGLAPDDQKAQLEQHLCVCDACFETLIDVLNQHLNQAGAWAFDQTESR